MLLRPVEQAMVFSSTYHFQQSTKDFPVVHQHFMSTKMELLMLRVSLQRYKVHCKPGAESTIPITNLFMEVQRLERQHVMDIMISDG